jgi:hypothetical protein
VIREGDAMDDTDLTGLDLSGAKEYIFAFAVEAKRMEKEIAAAAADLELWKGRIDLAEGKGMAELAAAARAKADEIVSKIAALEAERADIKAKVARMRENLRGIAARERSIDPDRLLAELQLMTGELLGEADASTPEGARAATDRAFETLESETKADLDLGALKKKAAEGQ